MMDAAKSVIWLIHGCQYRRVLSVSSNVMSIRRTDKHCGARLVAAPATLRCYPFAPLPRRFVFLPFCRLLSSSLSHPLHLSDSPLYLPTRLCAATYNYSTLLPYLPLCIYIHTIHVYIDIRHHYYNQDRHRHHYRQPSLLLSNSIRGALASSDSVLTRRAGILRFHQLPLLLADPLSAA